MDFPDFLKFYDVHSNQNMMVFNGLQCIFNAQITQNSFNGNILKITEQFYNENLVYSAISFQTDSTSQKPHLAVGTFSSKLKFCDYNKEQIIREFKINNDLIASQLILDHNMMLLGTNSGDIMIYDVRSPYLQQLLRGGDTYKNDFVFHLERQSYNLMSTKPRTIDLWDLRSSQILTSYKNIDGGEKKDSQRIFHKAVKAGKNSHYIYSFFRDSSLI